MSSCNGQSFNEPLLSTCYSEIALIPWSTQYVRFYNRKKTVKTPPTKPLRFIENLKKVDPDISLKPLDISQPKLEFEDVDALETADESTKKIFSLEFGQASDQMKKRYDLILKAVQEHPADIRSYEVRIARMTLSIRNQANHVINFRKDKKAKSVLNCKIGQRNKQLRILQNVDKEKYDWLCKELGLTFTPPPEFGYGKIPSKRALRKKIARDHYFDTRRSRLADFQEKLDKAMVEFEKEKAAELAKIQEELKEFGITEMTSVDQVIGDLGLGREHKIALPRPKPRKQQLLARKFEFYKGGANLYRYNRQKPSQK